jgi:S-DNA-T family DNA segregation ATPase FtsK/SpoIIIE
VGREVATAKRAAPVEAPHFLGEVVALITLAVALFVFVSFVSFQAGADTDNIGGVIGHGLSSGLLQAFGFAAYLIPLLLFGLGLRLFRSGLHSVTGARAAAAIALLGSVSVLLGVVLASHEVVHAGGWFGGFAGRLLRDACGAVGAYGIAIVLCILALMFTTESSLRSAAGALAAGGRLGLQRWRARRVQKPATLEVVSNRRRLAAPETPDPGPVILLREEVGAEKSKPPRRATQEVLPFASDVNYQQPSLNLLDIPRFIGTQVDEDVLRKSSEILEGKLANFGIEGRVVAVRPGPVITTFEIEPAPGVKVNRIVTLQDDLAMALRALSVRILAPVPGKAVVGIEVANAKREKVYLRDILETDTFTESESTLSIALGKDSTGNPLVADLARMPHLLLAGATGTGKSVSLNAMIMSILHKASPRDVRFVMIDLKMLELSLYEELPHLLVPVITDPKKAVVVLKNLVQQMDERYRLLKEKGVRNIDSYNRMIEEEEEDGVIELSDVVDGEEVAEQEPGEPRHQRLPKIVVIIDELADLMMTAGRHVEEPITRLAQKARACGMHLILATQRPSVDVITGLIKANFPARISFQVTARVDSRTILDCNGAERLLGGGDMLYLPPGTARVQRLHGPFVSEAEIRKVTDFVKQQGAPHYALEFLEDAEEEGGAAEDDGYDDAMYDQAVRLVTDQRQASISWLQRRLRVGYNRAARMIERMEREGVVSSSDGVRPREVLARKIEDD